MRLVPISQRHLGLPSSKTVLQNSVPDGLSTLNCRTLKIKLAAVTSQIAIFNSLGVAVASDTVTTHLRGQSAKTTSRAEKIWTLGDEHLAVALHSGTVPINGVNSRLFFTEWARTLDTPLETLADYPTSFVSWISANAEVIAPSSELELVHHFLNDHFYEIKNRTLRYLSGRNNEEDPSAVLKAYAQDGLEYLQGLELFEGTSDEHDAKVIDQLEINLDEKLSYIFKDIEGFEDSLEVLQESAPLVLSRAQDMDWDCLVSFVGFGRSEYFAKSVRTYLRGHYGGVTRCRIDEPFGASNDDTSGSLATFAQSEAIHGFLRGAHTSLINEACNFVWESIFNLIEDETGEETANRIEEELRTKIDEAQFKKFISPMLDTIGGLPLVGLAELAESLVGMQATYSAAGTGPASVGGLIESLVIDRARGVRWVNRLPL